MRRSSTTPQALELVNGETLTRWLSSGARRMLGELPPEPVSLYNRAVAGRSATSSAVRHRRLEGAAGCGSSCRRTDRTTREIVQPAWAQAELVGPSGAVPLSSLTPIDNAGLRPGDGPIRVSEHGSATGVRVQNPSVLVYDIAGRGFTRFRGVMGLENTPSEIGSTLNPQIRFFVFDTEPNMDGWCRRCRAPRCRRRRSCTRERRRSTVSSGTLLGRAPSAAERRIAEAALQRARRAATVRPRDGLADLLWAVTMKPEFQLIY